MSSNQGGGSSRSSNSSSATPNDSQLSYSSSSFNQPSTSAGNSNSGDISSPSNTSTRRHKRKNQPLHGPGANSISLVPGIFTGVPGSLVDKDSEFLCPICFEIYREAHMTKCGHSFCHECILKSMEQSPRCPKCNFQLDGKESLFPNFILDELVAKHQRKLDYEKMLSSSTPSKLTKLSSLGLPDDLIKPTTKGIFKALHR